VGDNQKVSLFDAGKSLEKFRVQDQDGLGTCYANVLSTLLQSHNKETEFSYHHLALMHGAAEGGVSKGSQNFLRADGRLMNEGGNLCSALAAAKEQGGVCPRSHFGFEKDLYASGGLVDKNSYQLQTMKNLMTFFDYQKEQRSDAKKLKLSSDLEKFKEFYDKKVSSQKLCEESPDIGKFVDPAELYVLNYIEDKLFDLLSLAPYDEFHNPSVCFQEGQKYLNSFIEDEIVYKNNYWSFGEVATKLKTEMKSRLIANLKNDPEYIKLQSSLLDKIKRPDYIAAENTSSDFLNNHPDVLRLMTKIEAEMKRKMINENPQFSILNEKCPELKLSELNDHVSDTKWELIKDYTSKTKETCARYKMLNYLGFNNVEPILKEFNNGDTCTDEGLKITHQAFYTLMKLGFDTGQIINQLAPSEVTYPLDKVLSAIAPDCLANKVSLKNVRCSESLRDYSLNFFKSLKKNVYDSINRGQAMSLAICANVFENPNSTLNKCSDHLHAVTLTGYRCDQGEIRYEILNSWGQHCPAKAEQGYKNEIFECEIDKESGQPTGRFWMREKELFKNTISFEKISIK
jgi:hypothetical protein